MKKCVVLFHGDCDGVIAAGLYIRRFLMDMYPGHIILKYSHPWRLSVDLRKVLQERDVGMIVLVDLAISEEEANMLARGVEKGMDVIVLDHHQSSEKPLEKLKGLSKVKILWSVVQSTPQVLSQMLMKSLNSYEQLLINVANVCEGGSSEDPTVKAIADKIKLVLAIEPTNIDLIRSSVEHIVRGEEFWGSKVFDEIYWKAKWLLNILIKRISDKAKTVCGWDIASFISPESMIFAGLFGVASSEYMKKVKKSVILIREEEDKIVITVRSIKKKALEICQAISNAFDPKSRSFFGGHREAASLTIRKVYTIKEVESITENIIRSIECENI